MFKSEQDIMNRIDSTHWWLVGNHNIAKEIIRMGCKKEHLETCRFLDVGCGVGEFLKYFRSWTNCFGLEYSFDALLHCQMKGIDKILQADATFLPFKDNMFDSVIMLDVAEHVEDDCLLMQEAYRVTRYGGYVFLMVPAFRVLWGSHDVKFYHKRRYSKKDVVKLVKRSGFLLKRFTFLHPHFFHLMFFMRYFDKRKRKGFGQRHNFVTLPKILNSFLILLMRLEGIILKVMNFQVGTTIFCILEKR